MRTALFLTLFALLAVDAASAAPLPWTHTRALTEGAAQLIEEAAGGSPIVDMLLESLERTDVVVYLSDSWTRPASGPSAYLTFVGYNRGTRYLLIRFDPWRTVPRERIAALAHELQHALEIAAAPEVQDAAGVVMLYRRIGWEYGDSHFETDAARAIGKRVSNQLAGFR